MDQQELRQWEARCIQEEPPACRAGCPLGVDARGFALAMAKGNLPQARGILDKTIPLAGLVARLCEAPCEDYCLRGQLGGAIALGKLERTCVFLSSSRGKILRLPSRNKSVTILGGGPSSLTAAFDLCKKGYAVTLLHLPSGPGGRLRHLPDNMLPKQILDEECGKLAQLGITFHVVSELTQEVLANFAADAAYIGQDDLLHGGFRQQLSTPDPVTFALPETGFFSGGMSPENHPHRLITDVAQGREAATSIDRYLQGASLTADRVLPRRGQTNLFTNTENIIQVPRLVAANPEGYSLEEAMQEAGRCLDCQCLECVRHCTYLAEYGAYPKTYARRVYNNSAIVQGIHQANRFINSCSLCRQCEVLCPNDFSMADLCLEARQLMVRENRMPPSAHWFALEEMEAASTETALLQHAPSAEKSEYLFFPGCQLAGIRPVQTERLYEHLREQQPATGIWSTCCGAPAHWSGRTQDFTRHLEKIRADWRKIGSPQLIVACATCLKMFREHLPEVPVVSVWILLEGDGFETGTGQRPLALTDPCTAREDMATQQSVRHLLAMLGQPLSPLPMSGEKTECCGFGGLMDNAAPATAERVRRARVAQSDADFLTYCAMCRDQLAKTGKGVIHLLDLLFPETAVPPSTPPVSISTRRENRRLLQERLTIETPPGQKHEFEAWREIPLAIAPEIEAMLETRRILHDDIRRVLQRVKETGCHFVHGDGDRRLASAQLGAVTFWVEYRLMAGIYHIDRSWSHRMAIKKGGVT